MESENEKRHKGSLGYVYSTRPAYIAPFSKLIPQQNKYLALIRDFNFNFLPTSFTLRNDINREVSVTRLRPLRRRNPH